MRSFYTFFSSYTNGDGGEGRVGGSPIVPVGVYIRLFDSVLDVVDGDTPRASVKFFIKRA